MTYDELEEAGIAYRSAKRIVGELKELNLVEVRGRPATIVVTDPVDRVLIAHLVSKH